MSRYFSRHYNESSGKKKIRVLALTVLSFYGQGAGVTEQINKMCVMSGGGTCC